MRILLFGRDGQLGHELGKTLAPFGDLLAVDKGDLDLTKVKLIQHFVENFGPEVIINAAAYTDVDGAEAEPDLALAVNATAPGAMAGMARSSGSLFIHYSTDYVFDGEKGLAYNENDPAHPINTYGRTKLAGEQSVQAIGGIFLILRTSWLYGIGQNSFPIKVLAWARQQKHMRIVEDQVGSPTSCRMLAGMTAALLREKDQRGIAWLEERSGLYHVAGKGAVNRFEWAKKILDLDPHPKEHVFKSLEPAQSEGFPTPAKRPRFSALDCHRFENVFGLALPEWEVSLAEAMREGF